MMLQFVNSDQFDTVSAIQINTELSSILKYPTVTIMIFAIVL
jgi:hypothetical protein